MSGLVKAKKYDWKDSNMALFGSDVERQVKKESAMTEPAWEGCGQEVGLQIWRIVKFKVTHWPKEDYGHFYTGDSYIILNTFHPKPESNLLDYDVHFWIGTKSSQDEYGTAAYKTVELDTFLDDAAVQHREVQGHESERFQSLFKTITIMEGGAETGFRHVTPEEYPTRLLHFSGKRKNIMVNEVPLCRGRLKSDDVFILDQGLQIYQWNGKGANKDEKWKAQEFLQQLRDERCGRAKTEALEESSTHESHQFYEALTGEDDEDFDDEIDGEDLMDLYRVSDESGSLSFNKVKDGDVSINDFISHDVFIFDTGKAAYVWVGKGASPSEKKNGMTYAHNHLMKSTHPLVPITVIREGQTNAEFEIAISA